MNTKKEFGKIKSVHFGHCGYQEAMIGIWFELGSEGWGVITDKCTWDPNLIEHKENCEWTEKDRDEAFAEIMRYISDLLYKAKVDSVDKLQGMPVEVTFVHRTLSEWRILTEVL